MATDFIEGGALGATTVMLVIIYLALVNTSLMKPGRRLGKFLSVSIYYRAFVAVFVLAGIIGSGSLIQLISEGSLLEQLVIWLFALGAVTITSGYFFYGFLITTSVTDNVIETRSPFGKQQVDLVKLSSFKVNTLFDRFVLEDDQGSVSFCHYVEGKRALIEHLLRFMPDDSAEELRLMLNQNS